METLHQILRPDFVLHDALVASVVIGLVCPLVGGFFLLRRMIFLGVALPQMSAAGIAFAFLVYSSVTTTHEHGARPERLLALAGSFGFVLAGLLGLVALERRERGTTEARIGAVYALAAAATLLFVAVDPFGEAQIVNLLKGDIVTTTGGSLALVEWGLGVVAGLLLVFRRELLLVSFDREMALVLGKRAALWDGLLHGLIGVTIALGVMTAGPLVTFGFLVVPPLAARAITRRMSGFSLASAALGGLMAFAGFCCAVHFDLPLGPTEVVLAGVGLGVTGLVRLASRGRLG